MLCCLQVRHGEWISHSRVGPIEWCGSERDQNVAYILSVTSLVA